jgi:hypothetical protein
MTSAERTLIIKTHTPLKLRLARHQTIGWSGLLPRIALNGWPLSLSDSLCIHPRGSNEELVQKRGLSKTPYLLARSRGGLMLYNWAFEHPLSVACVEGIYPVCNLSSYPGIKNACGAYGNRATQVARVENHRRCGEHPRKDDCSRKRGVVILIRLRRSQAFSGPSRSARHFVGRRGSYKARVRCPRRIVWCERGSGGGRFGIWWRRRRRRSLKASCVDCEAQPPV